MNGVIKTMGAALPIKTESEFWNTSAQDKNFRNIFLFLLSFSIAFGFMIYQYQVPVQPLLEKPEKKPVITQIKLEKKEPPKVEEPCLKSKSINERSD